MKDVFEDKVFEMLKLVWFVILTAKISNTLATPNTYLLTQLPELSHYTF